MTEVEKRGEMVDKVDGTPVNVDERLSNRDRMIRY